MAECHQNQNGDGFREMQKDLFHKSSDGCRFRHLVDRAIKPLNVEAAFLWLAACGGSYVAGPDGLSFKHLEKMPVMEVCNRLKQMLGHYAPGEVKREYINGRPFGVPCVWDRLLQQCVLQVLEPILEGRFHPRSYGFRPGRNGENALADLAFKVNRQHLYYVVSFGLPEIWEQADVNVLLRNLKACGIQDMKLLQVIKAMLGARVSYPDGHACQPGRGLFQAGLLAPLFLNAYLDSLDQWVSGQWETFAPEKDYTRFWEDAGTVDRSHQYRAPRNTGLKEMYLVRHGCDVCIVTDSAGCAERVCHGVRGWAARNLKLGVLDGRFHVCDLRHGSMEFLGFSLNAIRKGRMKDGRQRYVFNSHVSAESLGCLKAELSAQVWEIAKHAGSDKGMAAVVKYNSMVIRAHKYYSLAVNCNDDFNVLGAGIQKKLYNKLKRNNDTKRGGTVNFRRSGVYTGGNLDYQRYMQSATVRFYRGFPILPVGYVQHRKPMMLKHGNPYDK